MAAETDNEISGDPVQADAGGGLGNSVNTLDIPNTKLIPGVKGALTRLTMIDYEAAGTAHLVTPMYPLGDVTPTLTADVAVNATVINISEAVHDAAGNLPASGDWIAVKGANGRLYHFHIASYSSLAITITATNLWGDANGTGVPVALPTGNKVWFFGSPSVDHVSRSYKFKASTPRTLPVSIATPKVNQPMIVHADNVTAAATIFQIAYDNPKPSA